MPFVTEELWQNLKSHLPPKWQKTGSIMIAKYPKADKNANDIEAENIIESVIDITRALRNIRAETTAALNNPPIWGALLGLLLMAALAVIIVAKRVKPE